MYGCRVRGERHHTASPPSEEARSYGGTPDRVVPSPQSAILGEDCPAEEAAAGLWWLGATGAPCFFGSVGSHDICLFGLGNDSILFATSCTCATCLRLQLNGMQLFTASTPPRMEGLSNCPIGLFWMILYSTAIWWPHIPSALASLIRSPN
jgi:hypothetical protein